jgi:hypothetical protein
MERIEAERDALGRKFLAVFVRQCPFVSFHPRCSCPPRAALAPESNSCWGLATATVKIDKNGNKRKQTEKSKTGRRMLNQPESSRSAPGSLVPIPSNERMQSAVLHSAIEITNKQTTNRIDTIPAWSRRNRATDI